MGDCTRCYADGFVSCQCIVDDDWRDDPDLRAVRWNGHIVLVNRLANLAACLAVAAGLCLSFAKGFHFGFQSCPCDGPGLDDEYLDSLWRPGCGTCAPGFEGK